MPLQISDRRLVHLECKMSRAFTLQRTITDRFPNITQDAHQPGDPQGSGKDAFLSPFRSRFGNMGY